MTALRIMLGAAAALCGMLTALGAASAPAAQPHDTTLLSRLAEGRWELRLRGGGGVRSMCLGGDRRNMVQLRHPDLACERIVIENSPAVLTIQYTCRGHGYGRTQIRRESAQLVQIDSQGIADGLPFELSAEGRSTGSCAP